jgi:hypothetical protein
MEAENWIKRNQSGSILLSSWEHVANLYEIKDSSKITFTYTPDDNKRIDLLIYAEEIKLNQSKQISTLNFKLTNNPSVLEMIKEEISINFKIDASKLTMDQVRKYLLKLQIKNFQSGTTQNKVLQNV